MDGLQIDGPQVTINGSLSIYSNSPLTMSPSVNYKNESNLIYRTGSTVSRGQEWIDSIGAHTPFNVHITSNTTLNVVGNTPQVAKQLLGDLTIDSGSTVTMNQPLSLNNTFTIGRSLILQGMYLCVVSILLSLIKEP
jgi:hypothetical protein